MNIRSLAGMLLLMLIAGAGIFVRYDNLTGHFTHIDDLLVASTIMEKSHVEKLSQAILSGDSAAFRPYEQSGLYKDLNSLKDSPILYSVFYNYIRISGRFFLVSKESTYAPLQCGLVSWVVNSQDDNGYDAIKRKGRSFSFAFGILSIAVIILVVWQLYHESPYWYWLAAFAASLVAFSWEHIVYAQQMEPYTIAVFFHGILLWMLLRYSDHLTKWKHFAFSGLAIGAMCWGHYQMLFCSAAFSGTLILLNLRNKAMYGKLLLLIVAFAGVVVSLLPSIRTGGGVNWNAGHENIFLFSKIYSQKLSFGEMLVYPFRYFAYNSYVTIRAMVGFIPDEFSLLINGFVSALILLMILGIYSWFRSAKTNPYGKILLVYMFCIGAIWVLLIVAGKITLSPTRHSMVLMPLFILPALEGIIFCCRKTQVIAAAVSFLVLVQAGTFFWYYPQEKAERNDCFSESEIESLIVENKPDLVLSYGFTDNVPLLRCAQQIRHAEMHSPLMEYEEYESRKEELEKKYASVKNLDPARLLLISTRDAWNEEYNKALDRFIGVKMEHYKVILKKEISSTQEVEYSTLTKNGTNNLYYYLLEKN